ncbi:MAG TPA: hypothetical protein H9992_02315, partial [Candidatus Prevotella intestinigallinarum]|nr:hypothetical protein [Candidatus Prevotella intestinigallinarum]
SLDKTGGARAISNKFDCRSLALSLDKTGGARAIPNKFDCRSLALFLQWGWRMASFCEAETIGKHTSKQKHGIKRLSGKSDDWGSGKAPRQDCVARI